MARSTARARKNKKLIVTLSSIGAAFAIVFIVFLFTNTYYRDNYATKRYVLDALSGSELSVSEAEMGRIAAQISKDLNDSIGTMDVENLTDEQLKSLMDQVQTYLESEFTTVASETINQLANDIVKAQLSETLKDNSALIDKYQTQIDTLTKQTAELQKLMQTMNNYSYSDIYDVVKKYGMSEDDVKQFLSAYETSNSSKLKELSDKLGVSVEQLTALISSNASSNDAKIKDLSNALGVKETELKNLISNYNTSLANKIDSLQAYTINSMGELSDTLPSYKISTDSSGKTTVTMNIPSSHK
jgi:transcriptional regulator with XRE-family HTH domain